MGRWGVVAALALFLAFCAGSAEAKSYIDVYPNAAIKRVTVAVPPFKADKPDRRSMEMGDLLGQDLDFSGFFIVAPQSLMDKELSDEGLEKHQIRFAAWRSIGIELLCKAKLLESGGELVLEAYLYDIFEGSSVFAKRYRAKTEDWRGLIHRLADDIVLAATGEKGIMSSRIVYTSGVPGKKEIFISDIDGHGSKRLTSFQSITMLPSVSPNGRYLGYTSYKEGAPHLYVMDLDARKEVYSDREPGTKIGTNWTGRSALLYSATAGKHSTLYTIDVERKEKKVLLKGEDIYTSASVSPDGSKMVFVSDMYGSPQVFLKNLGSGETKRLTYQGNYNTAPGFSPKGDAIVYVAQFEGSFEIVVMNLDGSNPRVLTNGGINDSPQFSPCGRYILYSSKRGSRSNIYVMLYNGDNKRLLKLGDGNEEQPRFVP